MSDEPSAETIRDRMRAESEPAYAMCFGSQAVQLDTAIEVAEKHAEAARLATIARLQPEMVAIRDAAVAAATAELRKERDAARAEAERCRWAVERIWDNCGNIDDPGFRALVSLTRAALAQEPKQ